MKARLWLLLALAVSPSVVQAQQPVAWEAWQRVPGIVEVAGQRSDGNLVVVAAGQMYLVSPDGAVSAFAQGADGFSGSVDGEPYAVISPGVPDACPWPQDNVFVLDLTNPPGITQVDAGGHASHLATIAGVDTLNAIAFDTVGRFGHRLLVAGTSQNRQMVFAVDCQGGVTAIANPAPSFEGGVAVAPETFGQFAGQLIGADENGGQVWAIDSSGRATVVATPNLPTGGDTGVESVGFVPPGFSNGGTAYLADRGTPNNPFPGTDTVLRLSSAALVSAGVRDGDLLVATEGGGTTVAIRCETTCSVLPVADGPAGGRVGHIEGRITFILQPPR